MRTNDDASTAAQLVGKVDLVARRALDEVGGRQLVTDIDECRSRGVQEASSGAGAGQRQTAGG